MNSILIKLNVALTEAEALIESLKKQKNELGLSHALLDKGHEELKKKTADIEQRESVIQPIENVHSVKKVNDDKAVELQKGVSDLETAKRAFESHVKTETDRLNNLRINVEKENNNVVEGFKKLEQEKKNLEEEIDRRVKEFIANHVRK